MKKEENKKSNKFLIFSLVMSSAVIAIILAVTINYMNEPLQVITKELNGGSVVLSYTDDTNSLSLSGDNIKLYNDYYGTHENSADMYFDFSVSSELDEADLINYEISIVPDERTTIPKDKVRIYLEKMVDGTFTPVSDPQWLKLETKETEMGSRKGSMVIANETIKKSLSSNYRLRAWVDYDSHYELNTNDILSFNVEVHGKAS